MGYAFCGQDEKGREIGYGIHAECDQPGCQAQIDRGMAYVCGGHHGGGDHGCGGYFCEAHLFHAKHRDGSLQSVCRECLDAGEKADEWADD
jgi:hypothetical protein